MSSLVSSSSGTTTLSTSPLLTLADYIANSLWTLWLQIFSNNFPCLSEDLCAQKQYWTKEGKVPEKKFFYTKPVTMIPLCWSSERIFWKCQRQTDFSYSAQPNNRPLYNRSKEISSWHLCRTRTSRDVGSLGHVKKVALSYSVFVCPKIYLFWVFTVIWNSMILAFVLHQILSCTKGSTTIITWNWYSC